ncbi:MAG: hypothetical protein ACKVRN_08485 [Pyrinomonadaceae bacterium]
MSRKEKANTKRHEETPVWEWIIAAIGLVLVLAVISVTLYRAVTEKPGPPILDISAEPTVLAANGYLVTFRVNNTGSQTAAALTVEGNLMLGEETIETSTATLTYAPANSERHGGLFFTKDPSSYELKIRALGYEKP